MKAGTGQVLCRQNARDYWFSIDQRITDIFKKLDEEGINELPNEEHRFVHVMKGDRYELKCKELKQRVKHTRRFEPELKLKG